MKRLWIAIAVLMLATVGHAGKAEAGSYANGNDLLGWCESASYADNASCGRYLAGIADATGTYDSWGVINKGFCIPDSVTLGQLEKVAIKGLNAMPEELHHSAPSLVFNIFNKAFPC